MAREFRLFKEFKMGKEFKMFKEFNMVIEGLKRFISESKLILPK